MKHIATLTCEKVIVDQRNVHSLISLISRAEIGALPGAPQPQEPEPIPMNAVIPKEWYVFSMWLPSAEEVGKSFHQVMQIYWPNGDKYSDSKLPFSVTDVGPVHNSFHSIGMPVGQEGELKIVTWLEENDERITDIFDAHLTIKHGIPITRTPATTQAKQ
jgi:hypothetical protein